MGLFSRKKKEEFVSPMTGILLPIEQCPDPVFAGKIMGDGFAIELTGAEVTAPVSGTIATAFPTGHAYGINTDDGKEILIHIGIDTVAMNGEGFHIIAKTGQNVKCGDPLVEVDFEKIRKAGKSDSVIVIVTSGEKVETRSVENVKSGISEAAEIV